MRHDRFAGWLTDHREKLCHESEDEELAVVVDEYEADGKSAPAQGRTPAS